MASKQKNPNIGMVACAHCGDMSALRKNKAGKFYYDCLRCGRITPNMPGGQEYILERATIWGEAAPPENAPEWIAKQHNWRQALTAKQAEKKQPATGADLPPPPPAPKPAEKPPAEKPGPSGFSFLGDL